MAKRFEIRNSTAEFLIFAIEGKEEGIQVMYQNETIWCTQKAMAALLTARLTILDYILKTSMPVVSYKRNQLPSFSR